MQTDLECVGKLLVYDLDHAGKLALLPLREMFEARSHIQPIGLRRWGRINSRWNLHLERFEVPPPRGVARQ